MINTLGMTRDELAELREAFDAELLALSRLDIPQFVQVRKCRQHTVRGYATANNPWLVWLDRTGSSQKEVMRAKLDLDQSICGCSYPVQ